MIRRKLANGLWLRIVERHETPVVTMKLVVRTGETSTAAGKEGLCSLTASLLDEGTISRTGLQIVSDLLDIGASISASGWLESIEVNLTTLARHLEGALDLYTDVILEPCFSRQGDRATETRASCRP